MGFALDAFKKNQAVAFSNDAVANGQGINQARLDSAGTCLDGDTGGLAKTDNRLSLALAGDGFKKKAYNVELDSLEANRDNNLDGFKSFMA